ncbi:MAG: metal ABC transporter permease [Candidatus Zixiibacteriota bacterium]|nr:MAG: metal ABC transporter permease [candidate division Zixibacteria bacterium]
MIEFANAVGRYPFLQYALFTGVLASIACGVVGTYVVARRITYIGGGIAHSVLGGMGAAYYLSVVHGWRDLHPKYGAVVVALLSAVIIGWVSLKARQREDTVIGSIWAVGMAIGIIFISRTPGYNEDLMSYLFGNILMVSPGDLWLIGGLDLAILAIVYLFYNQFQAVCFDEEFARVRGINVEFYYLLLLGLTALTVVILVTVVGIVMVIALLTIPAAVAGYFTRTIKQTMLAASIASILFTTVGLAVSYRPDLPAGATTIVLAGATYLAVIVISGLRKTARASD